MLAVMAAKIIGSFDSTDLQQQNYNSESGFIHLTKIWQQNRWRRRKKVMCESRLRLKNALSLFINMTIKANKPEKHLLLKMKCNTGERCLKSVTHFWIPKFTSLSFFFDRHFLLADKHEDVATRPHETWWIKKLGMYSDPLQKYLSKFWN